MNKTQRIKELVELLNRASKAYYQESREIMTNLEYDRLYDELESLEEETGIILSDSPTVNVGFEVVSELPKVKHEKPMLSLNKTKSVDRLKEFCGDKKCILSWKLDGLTVVLTYENGTLKKAVTRGNGVVGEDVTGNARMFKNIPVHISYKGTLILRGEAVIKYSDFEKINAEIDDEGQQYKNPRNLCAGSVRQLNNVVTRDRNVNFIAFALIEADGIDFHNSMEEQLLWLENQGFDAVERKLVTGSGIEDAVLYFSEQIEKNDYPSDGLVLEYDDIEYGNSLGHTAKFPRNGIAFKWKDEEAETILRYIEWNASRTGLINPIAVFDSVELEGATVSRASVHNVSQVEELKLCAGDRIKVYKANMIIPQISENITKTGMENPPEYCPVCGQKTVIKNENGSKTLVCENPRCAAKNIESFILFASRDAMNIEGLSDKTIEKFVDVGFIREYADIYKLESHRDEILKMDGFKEKSYENLIDAVNRSRNVELPAFIYALGVPGFGPSNAKMVCRHFGNDLKELMSASKEELTAVYGIGSVMAENFAEYFRDEENIRKINNLLYEIHILDNQEPSNQNMEGITFVVTGSLDRFDGRSELKKYIEDRGGKVTGGVTSKTDYLINNDPGSASTKNKKAREIGTKIITENEFLDLFGE